MLYGRINQKQIYQHGSSGNYMLSLMLLISNVQDFCNRLLTPLITNRDFSPAVDQTMQERSPSLIHSIMCLLPASKHSSFLILLLMHGVAHAGVPLVLNDGIQHLGPLTKVLYDESNQVSEANINDVVFLENTSRLIKLHNTDGQYWLKFTLKNNSNAAQERILSIDYAHVKKLLLYQIKNHLPEKTGLTSAEQSYKERIIASRYPSLRLSVPAFSETQYIVKLQLGHIPLEYAVKLYPVDQFYKSQLESTVFFILFTGFLLALLIYNLSLYYSLRLPQFLYYSTILFLAILVNLGYEGFLYMLFDGLAVDSVSGFIVRIGSVVGILLIQFTQNTVALKRYVPRLNRYANFLKVILLILLIISFSFVEVQAAADPLLLIISLAILVLSVRVYRNGNKAALYIVMAMLFFLTGGVSDFFVFTTQDSVMEVSSFEAGYLEWLRNYFYYICQAMAYFFMSMALAFFVRQLRDERDVAQQTSVEALEESNRLKDNYAQQLESDIETATTELRQQAELLKQLDRQKSLFFTNISHEFRTPLTLIKGPVLGMAGGEYGELNDKGKLATDICCRNIDRLSRLIDELLMLAEVESGASRLKASFADVNQFCRRTAALFTHTALEKNIQFILNIPLTALPLYFDAAKLEKVLCNLLSNAFKYTPEGGEVVFSVAGHSVADNKDEEKSTGTFIDITVEDNGPGISDSEQMKVFDRFFRTSHSDESAVEGSGIGLSLVKDLVTLHGGGVSVQAKNDAQGQTGSCFTVNLPLGKAHLHEDEIQIHHSIMTTQDTVALSSKKQTDHDYDKTLLVVEDNTDMRNFVVSLLDQDYRIIEAVQGKQALQKLSEHSIDLLISDIMMPVMDGIRLLENIRNSETWHELPVILLTARAADEDRIQALRARADEYLAKPFNAEELKLKVANLLRRTSTQSPAVSHSESERLPAKVLSVEAYSSKFLNSARECVLLHLSSSDFDVTALADALHMSRSTLQRRMETEAGVTAALFIREVRLQQAHELLENRTYRTLAETAYAVGFSHPGYFSKLYKNYAATHA